MPVSKNMAFKFYQDFQKPGKPNIHISIRKY